MPCCVWPQQPQEELSYAQDRQGSPRSPQPPPAGTWALDCFLGRMSWSRHGMLLTAGRWLSPSCSYRAARHGAGGDPWAAFWPDLTQIRKLSIPSFKQNTTDQQSPTKRVYFIANKRFSCKIKPFESILHIFFKLNLGC